MAEVTGAKIEIDQEFASLIPKPSSEELSKVGLEITRGCKRCCKPTEEAKKQKSEMPDTKSEVLKLAKLEIGPEEKKKRPKKRANKPVAKDVAVSGPGYVDVETIDDLKTDYRYPAVQEMLDECCLTPDLSIQWTIQQNKRKQDIFVGWVSDCHDRRHLVAVDYPKGVYHVPDDDPAKWNIGIGDRKNRISTLALPWILKRTS